MQKDLLLSLVSDMIDDTNAGNVEWHKVRGALAYRADLHDGHTVAIEYNRRYETADLVIGRESATLLRLTGNEYPESRPLDRYVLRGALMALYVTADHRFHGIHPTGKHIVDLVSAVLA